jgi:hypothetical protein
MFDLLNNYENKVFISGQELLGVENVNISYSQSTALSRFLGMSTAQTLVAGETQKQVTFSRYLIYNDPVLSLTGSSPTSGSINYNGQAYGFNSGFLTEYKIGSILPAEVITDRVIEFSASVQIDVDDAFLQNASGFLSGRQNKTVTFTVKSKDNTQTIQQLTIPNASLIGETLASSADGGVKLTLNYIGHS